MNHRHRKVLQALFAHPISANIAARDVETLLTELGATVENRHGGRMGVHLNDHFAEFAHRSAHALTPDQARHVHKFLTDAKIDPEDYPA